MFDLIKLQKVFIPVLFVVFFIWVQIWLHLWLFFSPYREIVCNYNGPFGISIPSWLSLGSAVGIMIIIILFRNKLFSSFFGGWPFFLILSGGLGNILERFTFGCIMDYIAIFSLPVFNIADIALTLGVIGVVWKWRREHSENI